VWDPGIRVAYLVTWAGGRQKRPWNSTGEGGSLSGVSKVGEGRDGGDRNLFLAETSLGVGHEGGDDDRLGHHGGDMVLLGQINRGRDVMKNWVGAKVILDRAREFVCTEKNECK
jgi:hypothetical protein